MQKKIFLCYIFVFLCLFGGCSYSDEYEKESEISSQQSIVIDTEISSKEWLGYDEYDYSFETLPEYGGVVGPFTKLVNEDALNEWFNAFNHVNNAGYREGYECNMYSFIKEFNISKDDFVEICKKYEEYSLFTDEQIDLLFCGDEEYILDQITNPYAIRNGTKIYTPEWLLKHTATDYYSEGITPEMIMNKYEKLKSLLLPEHMDIVEENCSELAEIYLEKQSSDD